MTDPITVGWIAAAIATLGFGSFAVPIKSEAADSVDVDPLVMQSYKSCMCFLTSWLVLGMGQEFSFTYWGIISGLFWVPAGAFNIFAIRNAGLAVSQGIVSSSIVMVSFIWGNIVFREKVKSELIAYFAVCLIMTGLYGMSYFSSSESNVDDNKQTTPLVDEVEEEQMDLILKKESGNSLDDEVPKVTSTKPLPSKSKTPPRAPLEISPQQKRQRKTRKITICGTAYSRRHIGLCSALACGIWGGSCLVPMHYATGNVKGLGYVISFSIGAITITILMWILRFLFQLVKLKSVREAYDVLPSFHLAVMWQPGMAAGCLWSLGNVGSIVAVEHLGQGVGYSASQAALLVAGLWGIFYYKEVTKPKTIGKWFLSAFLTIFGILLLGYESRVGD